MNPGYRSSLRRSILSFPKAAIRLAVLSALLSFSAIVASAQSTSVTDGKTPTGLSPGAPAGSYPLSGFENVNLYNGNLSFRLPLLNIGGRGSSGYTMMLPIEQKWIVKKGQMDQFGNKALLPSPNWWTGKRPGYGPGVLQGRRTGAYEYEGSYCFGLAVHSLTLTRLTFTSADGTEYELRDQVTGGEPLQVQGVPCEQAGGARGKVFVTPDGSAATFISDEVIYDHKELNMSQENRLFFPSGYLFLKDGTRYRIDNGEVSWIRDHNGNQTTFGVNTITDSLGRVVTIAHLSGYDEIQYKGFGATSRTVRVWYDTLENLFRPNSGYSKQTYQSLFPLNNSPNTYYNPARVSKVELPDGRFYQFYYNPDGEVARVVLPTGGAFEYDWDGTTDSSDEVIFRYVTERRVYTVAGGAPENRTQYLRGNAGAVEVNSLSPAGVLLARSLHYFFGEPFASLTEDPGTAVSASPWKEGREYKIETFEVVNGVAAATPKQVTENIWEQPVAGSTWPLTAATTEADPYSKSNSPQITQTVNTLADTNQVTKQRFAYDRYGNRTDVYEFDYGTGAAPTYPLRHTHVDYLTANVINGLTYNYDTVNPSTASPDAALTIHIRGLASGQKVYAVNPGTGAETLKAQSEVKYDESSLLPYDTVTGWSNPGTSARGLATTTRSWLDTTNTWLESHAQYDQCGSVRMTWDARDTARTNPSQVSYLDAFSDSVARNTYAFPTTVTTAVPDSTGAYGSSAAFTSTTVYDFSTGLVTATVDPNNVSTTFEYDAFLNRPKRAVRAAGTGLQTQVTIDYDDVSHIITTTSDQAAYNDNLLKGQTLYDGLGRTTETRQYEGGTNYIASRQEYDAFGRGYKSSNPFRPQNETPVWTTTVFDSLGRVKSVTTPDGAAVNTDYSGSQVLVKDQMGKERMSQTNALGQLTDVWEITGADDSTESVSFPNHSEVTSGYRTKYAYDTLGNLITVTQRKGTDGTTQTRTFVYDSIKRLRSATNPESGTVCYGTVSAGQCQADGYDANGNLKYKTDARGVQSSYVYDALNRNTSVDYSNTTVNPDITRAYDNAASGANGKGRLWYSYAGGTDTIGTTVEQTTIDSYDALGRPLIQRQLFKTNGNWSSAYQTSRTYDLAGHVKTQAYPSGHLVTYNYDAAGRLADKDGSNLAFTGNLGEGGAPRIYASGISYSSLGGMAKEKFGTDAAIYNQTFYNSRGQLGEIRAGTVDTTADTSWNRGKFVNWYSLQCGGANCNATDNNGNLRKQEVYIPGGPMFAQTFEYDSLNRLKSASEGSSWRQEYVYDRYGNRTISGNPLLTFGNGINSVQSAVSPATNRMYGPNETDANHTLVDYDAAGNQIKDLLTTYGIGNGTRSYDAENRMTIARDASGNQIAAYTYNSDGQRVRRNVGVSPSAVETWQVYGMDGELLAEYAVNAAAASPQKEYGYRNGHLLITAEAAQVPATNGYAFSRSIAINHAKVPNTDQTNFPVLISGTYSYLKTVANGGNVQNANGYDVIFTSDAGCATKLNHEVENYNAATGEVNYWVKVPTVSHTNDSTIYMCYGKASITADQANPSGVWDANYKGVWHLGNGTSLSGADSTNQLGGTNHSAAANTGKVGGAAGFNGANYVSVGTSALTSGITLEAWLYRTGSNGFDIFADFGWNSTDGFVALVGGPGGANHGFVKHAVQYVDSGVPSPVNSWQHVVWTVEADKKPRLYINGSLVFTSSDSGALVAATHGGSLGSRLDASGNASQYFTGRVDEARLSNTVRSADWLTAEYNNQSSPATFYTISASSATAAQLNWLVTDHLGTPRMIFDQTGALDKTKRHDYLPFGEEISLNTGGRTAAQGYTSDTIRQKFTQKERDIETGLDYFLARYYSSTQGRFSSADPLAASANASHPQTWNRYSYCYNKPLALTDPSGLVPGDAYDQSGDWIANDGLNDNKAYLITNKADVEQLKEATTKGTAIDNLADVSSALLLPDPNVRLESGVSAVERSNSPTGGKTPRDDMNGGFHEEGGGVIQTANGQAPAPALPGPVQSPATGKLVTLDPLLTSNATAQMISSSATSPDNLTFYHVHPSGTIKGPNGTSYFVQPPSEADRRFATSHPATLGYHIVIGAGARQVEGRDTGGQTVYFYNGSGSLGTMPLNRYINLPRRPAPRH